MKLIVSKKTRVFVLEALNAMQALYFYPFFFYLVFADFILFTYYVNCNWVVCLRS